MAVYFFNQSLPKRIISSATSTTLNLLIGILASKIIRGAFSIIPVVVLWFPSRDTTSNPSCYLIGNFNFLAKVREIIETSDPISNSTYTELVPNLPYSRNIAKSTVLEGNICWALMGTAAFFWSKYANHFLT